MKNKAVFGSWLDLRSVKKASYYEFKIFTTLLAVVLSAASLTSAFATARTWNGGGADNFWTTAESWGGIASAVNSDILTFSGTLRQNNTNDYTAITNIGLAFSSDGWLLNGNAITQGGNITNTDGTNVINNNISLTASASVNRIGRPGMFPPASL